MRRNREAIGIGVRSRERHKLHHLRRLGPSLPPPRILHPQRRTLDVSPPSSPPKYSPSHRQTKARARIRASDLRSGRHTTTKPSPCKHAPEYPPAQRAKTPPPRPRLRHHRLRRRLLHLPSRCVLRGPTPLRPLLLQLQPQTHHRRSPAPLSQRTVVPHPRAADYKREV